MFAADKGRLPNATDIASNGVASAIVTQAGELDGKYFNAGDVDVKENGVIAIKFTDGANSGKGMTLTPTATSSGQISHWTCAGDTAQSGATNALEAKSLPSSCQ